MEPTIMGYIGVIMGFPGSHSTRPGAGRNSGLQKYAAQLHIWDSGFSVVLQAAQGKPARCTSQATAIHQLKLTDDWCCLGRQPHTVNICELYDDSTVSYACLKSWIQTADLGLMHITNVKTFRKVDLNPQLLPQQVRSCVLQDPTSEAQKCSGLRSSM